MKLVRVILLLSALGLSAFAQQVNVTANKIKGNSAAPAASCTSQQVYLKTDGTLYTCASGTMTAVGSPAGVVTGPGSSTDNAVVRFDGAGGATVQNSVVFIGDTGSVTGVLDLGVGLGAVATPTKFTVGDTASTTPRGLMSWQSSDDANSAHLHMRKSRGTFASPTTIVTADVLGRVVFSGYDGSAYNETAYIRAVSTGTILGTRVPSFLEFRTSTDATPSVATVALTLGADQTATFAQGVSAKALSLTGTGGAGFVSYPTQSSAPSAPASGFTEYADSTGRKSWIRASDGFTRTWDATLTANRAYTLPDATTTIAGLAVAQTFTAAQSFSSTITQTSASATAFESGPNGVTNPVLRLVNSVSSQAAGLSITGNAAGLGVTLTAISSGANENIILSPKGSGVVRLTNTNTYAFDMTNANSLRVYGSTNAWTAALSSRQFWAEDFNGGTVGYFFSSADSSSGTGLMKAATGVVGAAASNTVNAGWFTDAGIKRVSTQFDKTSSTTLANITGLSVTLTAGRTYAFEAVLYTTSNIAGGVKAAISGTATFTSIIYEAEVVEGNTLPTLGTARASAKDTTVGDVTTVTSARIVIKGTATVNAGGTMTVQFAQNASNGTASSVLVGSSLIARDAL